jgi:uncharacterized iron-regulated protein
MVDPQGRPVDMALFDALARRADYILIGEGHTSVCDHRMQVRLIDRLAASGEQFVIGLEMVPTDKAHALARFNEGKITLDELPDALNWKRTWGYPFSLYKGIFRAAQAYHLPMEPLNVPRSVVRAVSEKGADGLSDEQSAYLPPRIVRPPGAQLESLRASFLAHADMPGMHGDMDQDDAQERLERFIRVQSLWDSKMAHEAVAARRRYDSRVVVLAGGGHVEFGWGIAHRLAQFDPGARILLVMPWRGTPDELGSADLLFYCPPIHRSSRGMSLEVRGTDVVVTEVVADSVADKAGLRKDDIVRRAMDRPVTGLTDLHKAGVRAFREKAELVFEVERDGEMMDVNFGAVGGHGGEK